MKPNWFSLPLATLKLCLIALVGCSDAATEQSELEGNSDPMAISTAAATPQTNSPAVMMKAATVMDPQRGMVAYQMLVPEGWTLEGQVTPPHPGFHMIPYFSDVTVEAPDKRGVRFWGPQEFGYADGVQLQPFTPYQGRPFMPMQNSLGAFWQFAFRIAPAPGVTDLSIVEEEVMNEASDLVRRQLAPLYQSTAQENAQLSMHGEGKTFDVHVRRLVIRYKDEGTPVEATIFATVRHAIYFYPTGAVRAAMWNLDNMYGVYGPIGTDYLNDPLLAAVVRSRKEAPQWSIAIQQWYLQKNRQIVAEGQARIAATARQAATTRASQSEDVLDISFNGWKRRNAISDAGQSQYVNSIHEQTTYHNPVAGQTINLPSYYQNVYTDQLGNYILHNDANYQINTDPAFNNVEWTRIEPTQ